MIQISPYQSIKQGLKYCSISLNEIDTIVFYEKPFLKFERLLETYVKNFLFGFKSFLKSMPLWSKEKLFQKRNILNSLRQIDPNFSDINIKIFAINYIVCIAQFQWIKKNLHDSNKNY